jgi:hypothetical protein
MMNIAVQSSGPGGGFGAPVVEAAGAAGPAAVSSEEAARSTGRSFGDHLEDSLSAAVDREPQDSEAVPVPDGGQAPIAAGGQAPVPGGGFAGGGQAPISG